MKYDVVLVEWVDSYGCSPSWEEVKTPMNPELHICLSIGYEVHADDNCIVIIPHLSPETDYSNEQGCGDMTIPRAAILKREILVERKKTT